MSNKEIEVIYIDSYKFNNSIGKSFVYRGYAKDKCQRLALMLIQNYPTDSFNQMITRYTNWFYYKDPYPNQELYIKSFNLFAQHN